MKLKKNAAKAIKSVTQKMAKEACGSASHWGVYQPKEPKKVKK